MVRFLLALVLLAGCQHLPGGSKIGIELQIGNNPPPTHADIRRMQQADRDHVLIGGQVVPQAQHPDIVRISAGGGSCTATIVGPRAVLTAAHCVGNGNNFTFRTVDGRSFTARATHSPKYRSDDEDIAMGLATADIAVAPASVRTDRFEFVGMPVDLFGYGCTQPGGGGGNDGQLRTGRSAVVRGERLDLVLRASGGAALCYGDSGGPVKHEGRVIAVNSKGNIRDTSYVTRLTLPGAAAFLRQWSEQNRAGICGLTIQCGGGQPPPGPGKKVIEGSKFRLEYEE